MSRHGVIVIGGGANGLTAAGLLAKSGRKVILVEGRDHCGGLAGPDTFAGNYTAPGPLHDTSGIRHQLLAPLDLPRHGLELQADMPSVFGPAAGSDGLLLHHEPAKAAPEIAKFSSRDADRYAAFRAFIETVRGAVNNVLDDSPLDLNSLGPGESLRGLRKAAAIRRLGKRTMMELLRVGPMAVADWLDEYFETDVLKAIMCGPAVFGSFLGPRSPGSATNLLVHECRKGPRVKGGATAFVGCLENAVRAQGVEVRTGARVERIRVASGRVEGVSLEGGETIDGAVVVSTVDPKQTFLGLLARGAVQQTFADRIRHYRCDGTTAKVNLALNVRARIAGRGDETIESIRTGSTLDDVERAFDPLKYHRYAESPVLDIYVPAENGFAPDKHSVMSVLFNFAPYRLSEPWDNTHHDRIGDIVVAAIKPFVPDIEDAVTGIDVMTPREIESRYGAWGGHILHGDHQLDQLFSRPSPEAASYATPIEGLFICGSGTHPGGGLTCAPGALGARAVLAR